MSLPIATSSSQSVGAPRYRYCGSLHLAVKKGGCQSRTISYAISRRLIDTTKVADAIGFTIASARLDWNRFFLGTENENACYEATISLSIQQLSFQLLQPQLFFFFFLFFFFLRFLRFFFFVQFDSLYSHFLSHRPDPHPAKAGVAVNERITGAA